LIFDSKCSEAFSVILPHDHVSGYDNHLVIDQLLKLLKIAMNDDKTNSWIEYFLYELNFGPKYYHGCANNADGSFIDLSDAGKLWDFLKNK
jgi:hypothetical protein